MVWRDARAGRAGDCVHNFAFDGGDAGARRSRVEGDVLPAGGVEEGAGVKMLTREIIPPEPHSKGPDIGKAWACLPRWLRFVLFLMLIAVATALTLVFVK